MCSKVDMKPTLEPMLPSTTCLFELRRRGAKLWKFLPGEHSKFQNFFVYPYEIFSIHGMVFIWPCLPPFSALHHTMET
jgi:hypothetical protein